MTSKRILILPGDGVGPEVTTSAVTVLNAATDSLDIEFEDIGICAYDRTEQYLPAETIDRATVADAIIAGVVMDIKDPRCRNPVRDLKKHLNLYAVERKFFPLSENLGIQGVDLILMTGNPDVLLSVVETESLDGVSAEKYLSVESCRKIFRKTMRIAEMMSRRKITCAHRSNMFPTYDGIFVSTFYKEFAASEFLIDDMDVEAIAGEFIMDPRSMDVIVSTDLYGSVLAGEAAGMVGGSYLTPMGSIGDGVGLFEPMHGPKLEMAEKGIVNPTSAILSGAMALDHIGMHKDAEDIRKAVRATYMKGCTTPDMGGTSGTDQFTGCVVDMLKKSR